MAEESLGAGDGAGKSIDVHEAANLFPLMSEDRHRELVESVRVNGLRHPIVLCEGKILDGRNRYRACAESGVEPRFDHYDGDPFAYAWDANGQRRDLVADQRYLIWKRANERSEAWQNRRQEIQDEANRKRSEAAKAQPRTEDGLFEPTGDPTTSGTTRQRSGIEAKAAASGTNRGSVERMDKLDAKRPDLAEKVASGELKPTAALRTMKKEEVAETVAALPEGKYRVIYADPPWQYNDSREGLGGGDSAGGGVDRASTAANNHYPTMSMAELGALEVNALAPDDCVLLCWATFPLLPAQLEVIKAWGFKYKTSFVWDKGHGAFGHYHDAEAELLIVATKGSCTPDANKKEKQIQRFPRGAHSAKPEEWRELIDRLWPHGPRIELFRRGAAPDGWHVWGAEAGASEAA